MNTTPQPPIEPVATTATTTEGAHEKEPVLIGIVIAIVIILLALFIGALYLWFSRLAMNEESAPAPMRETTTAQPPATSETPELDTIESELDAEFSSFDEEFAELDAALASSETAQ